MQALSQAGALREPETAGYLRRLHRRRARRQSEARPSAWSPRCCRCRRPTNGWWCAPSPIPDCRTWKSLLRAPRRQLPARQRHDRRSISTGDAADARRDRARQEPDVSRKGGDAVRRQAAGAGDLASAGIRNCSTRCGASISRPASTGRSGASSRCCRGRRTATAPSGSRSAAWRSTRSPTTPRATPTCSRCSRTWRHYQEPEVRPILDRGDPRRRDHARPPRIRKEAAGADRQSSSARGRAIRRDMKMWG